MGWVFDRMDESFGCMLAVIGGGIVLFSAVIVVCIQVGAVICEKTTWPLPIAQYEQLRADASKIDLTASPQVMGQVSEFNACSHRSRPQIASGGRTRSLPTNG